MALGVLSALTVVCGRPGVLVVRKLNVVLPILRLVVMYVLCRLMVRARLTNVVFALLQMGLVVLCFRSEMCAFVVSGSVEFLPCSSMTLFVLILLVMVLVVMWVLLMSLHADLQNAVL